MEKYKILIFDLDDTLIDNTENVRYGFKKMVEANGEEYSDDNFLRWYQIDCKFWRDRQDGKIVVPENMKEEEGKKSQKFLDWIRAQRVLIYFNYSISLERAIELNNIYMKSLMEVVVPIEGAYEILKYLSYKYKVVIATNGPEIAVREKISKIDCISFIDKIYASENFGYMKPDKRFFLGIQEDLNNYNNDEYLIIGDSLKSDVEFGMNCGFDSCWFNKDNKILENEYKPTFVINSLLELKEYLSS